MFLVCASRAPDGWEREHLLSVSLYAPCAQLHAPHTWCSEKISSFVVFSLWVWEKRRSFQPKPNKKYDYKYNSFHSQILQWIL